MVNTANYVRYNVITRFPLIGWSNGKIPMSLIVEFLPDATRVDGVPDVREHANAYWAKFRR